VAEQVYILSQYPTWGRWLIPSLVVLSVIAVGAHVVSLGMVALADTSQEMTPVERQLVRLVTNRLHLLENRETLFNFKQKFHPCWESRYLVTNTTLALSKIALAVLRLRNYAGGEVARLLRDSDKP